MQLQEVEVVIFLVLTVQFCNSIRNVNKRNYSSSDRDTIEDAYLSTPQLLSKYGYPIEIHTVITKDGYILELHRIPKPRAVPVLLIHALFYSSSIWVVLGPDKSLAYLLYDQGYDVWMANARGSIYSRKHIYLNPTKRAFWNFTFHESGIYDLPTTIDYILQITNFKKLQLIGHSQGATIFFIMCSLLPEYNNKIISMQALGPAAFIGESKSPVLGFLSHFQDQIFNFLFSIGTYKDLISNDLNKILISNICLDGKITRCICSNIIFLITGFDEDQVNRTMMPVVMIHALTGTSMKQVLHFAQLKKSGRFRQFDYGMMKNFLIYDRITPPDYDLTKVTAKVTIHYATNDYLVVPKDIEKLRKALPNVVGKYLVDFPRFNHIDFIWAIDARELVYYKVIKLMRLIEDRKL